MIFQGLQWTSDLISQIPQISHTLANNNSALSEGLLRGFAYITGFPLDQENLENECVPGKPGAMLGFL